MSKIESILRLLVGAGLLTVAALMSLNVICRYFLGFSISWVGEVSRYLVVWVTFIGIAICAAKDLHMRVDVLLTILSEKSRDLVDRGIFLICGLACLGLSWATLKLTLKVTALGQISNTLGIPMTFIYGAMPVGFGFAGLMFLRRIFVVPAQNSKVQST